MRLKPNDQQEGHALITVVLIVGVSLLMLGAMLSWMSTNKGLTYRYNQHTRSIAAAEAATEKVLLAINQDYKSFGQAYVLNNIDKYRKLVPTKDENSYWANYTFRDRSGNPGVQIDYEKGTNLVVVSSQYRGLLGFPGTFRVSASAQELNSVAVVSSGVEQRVQASLIPVFQFAMFYNLDYENGAGPAMVINGPVHCNGDMYIHPGTGLTFNNDVTCTKKIYRVGKTGNPSYGTGPVTFKAARDGGVSTLTLPIGTNNSVAAVRQVVEVPPASEDPNSPLGQQRLYNKADLIILVSNNTVTATSGRINNFATPLLWSNVSQFVRTNISFYNGREKKMVRCTEIDIQKLVAWNNDLLNPLRLLLPYGDVRVVYVADYRLHMFPTNQPGIRLVNGRTLPPQGLTIATPHPLYVLGNYNCINDAHLGTTNTSSSLPASLICDAITILSSAWNDAKGADALSTRIATETTVNAATIAGIVQTSSALGYSGGVENLLRFLEDWTTKKLTYNGSMVVMFESRYAIAKWAGTGGYYSPPIRNWAFDSNFRDPFKLPPAAPTAYALIRGGWSLASSQ